MPDKFQNKYRISSARLSAWDYSSNGAYFITICTAKRQNYFGEIINAETHLSEIGKKVYECWYNIPNHFPHFYLDEFIIMPNHIHGIVLIEKPYIDNGKGFNVVETRHALSLRKTDTGLSKPDTEESKQPHPRFRNPGKNTISSMIGSFKSAVTKYCNENRLLFGWQSRFHDHIIKDNDEFHRIRNYIMNNPANWEADKFFSS
jgi:REP element-mobilizing transposase RayT